MFETGAEGGAEGPEGLAMGGLGSGLAIHKTPLSASNIPLGLITDADGGETNP